MQRSIITLLFTLALLLGSSHLSAWTAPGGTPPANNVAAPLHTGAAEQTKQGNLAVQGDLTTNGLAVEGPAYINGAAFDVYFHNTNASEQSLWRMRRNDGTGNWHTYINTEGGLSPTRYTDGYAYRETYNPGDGAYRFETAANDAVGTPITWQNAISIKGDGSVDIDTLNVNNLNVAGGGGMPPGAVMPFYLTTCPAGWVAADGTNGTPDLRGAFARGLNGDQNGRDETRTVGSFQAGSEILTRGTSDGGQTTVRNYDLEPVPAGGRRIKGPNDGSTHWWHKIRPDNVALLYCMKS